jgi:predicted ferric reductase
VTGSLRGPLLLVAASAAPAVLWATSVDVDQRFTGTYASLTSAAVVLGLVGTAAFALNLVLGARLPLVAAFFGGLDRMYRTHRVNGEIAFLLLAGHVALILASRATISTPTALELLGPGAGRTVFAGVVAFAAMTVALALTLFARLGHEVFVYIQRSFGFAFLLASYHVFTSPGAKQGSTALTAYLAVVASAGIAAFAYRSLLGNLLVHRRPYRVAAVNRLDELVTEIVLEPLGRRLLFTPGQFVFVGFRSPRLSESLHPLELSLRREVFAVRAGEIRNQFHPFSITSAVGDRTLRLDVKALGDYTRALRQLEPGATAVVEGPYGSFSDWNVPGCRQVWIAGGIGVTPFVSMARSLAPDERVAVDFYYCVEHEEEAHFLADLRAIAESRPGFRVVLVTTAEDGYLTARRVAEECPDLRETDVFLCGPPAMLASLQEQLETEGVRRERIHAEVFAFAGRTQTRTQPPARTSTPPADRKLLAALGAVAFAGPALALTLVLVAYLAAEGW